MVFGVFFLEGGSPAPHVNETYYLVKAKHYWDPGFCSGNLFLESADAHAPFYWTLGWMTLWWSLPTVAWIGRCVCWFALAAAWQRLSWSVVPLRFASALTAALMLALVGRWHFAGEWIVGGVEGKCFAYPLVVLGLWLLSRGRWNLVWPALGLAGAFHPLVGGWSVIAAACVWLSEPKGSRPALPSMLPALVLGGLLALPGLWPALRLNAGVSPEVAAESARIYVFDRLAHHLAPLSKPDFWIVDRAARHTLLILAMVVSWLWLRGRDQEDPAAVALDRLYRFAAATLLLSFVGLLWETLTAGNPTLSAWLLRYYPFRMADVALPIAVSLGAAHACRVVDVKDNRLRAPLVVLLCLLPTWHFSLLVAERTLVDAPPADRGVFDYDGWQDVCRWVRENTPPDAVFLTPRSGQSFHWRTGRRDVANWKDIPQDAAGIVAWRRVCHDLFEGVHPWGQTYVFYSLASQGAARVLNNAHRYGADYVVTERLPPLQMPLVYVNDTYAVYSARGARPTTAAVRAPAPIVPPPPTQPTEEATQP